MGVDEHLLAGLGVLDDQQTEVGQVHLQRVGEPHRQDLVPLCEMGERLRPAGALMKSETTNTSDRLGMSRKAARRNSRRFVAAD